MLRLRLETGRTHQIRVHAQAAQLPLIGDPLYGPSAGQAPAGVDLQRPALHARRLSFEHPVDKTPLTFRAALPADLLALWQQLELQH